MSHFPLWFKLCYYPQVTKALCTLVGTSEAIRLLSSSPLPSSSSPFSQWLAGLIDGDGCFLLSKNGYASLEITMDIRDEHCLNLIKNTYGGSIKLRSNSYSLRYRLHHKSGLLHLIHDINGNIRNPIRILQLTKICDKYHIPFLSPSPLSFHNGWFAGFFDADGSVSINFTNFQLSISVSQKSPLLLNSFLLSFGGSIYIDRSKYQSFKWYITKKSLILSFISYFKFYPSRSGKKHRLHLIPKFYFLKSLNAHHAPISSKLHNSWNSFLNKWSHFYS